MGYTVAFFITAVATLISVVSRDYLDHSNLIMIYLLCIVYIASRFGKGPSVLASILSVLAFDFFCIPPHYTLQIADSQFILTFLIMLFIALLIATLTSQVQSQVSMAKLRERRSEALHALSHELSLTRGKTNLLLVSIRHIRTFFDAPVYVYLPDESGELSEYTADTELRKANREPNEKAIWVFKNQRMTGLGQGEFASSKSIYLPLKTTTGVLGVLQIVPNVRNAHKLAIADLEFIQTFASQTALCMEVASLTEQNQEAQLRIESEQLRNALLSSVSHDLRTPLSTITGASSSLLENRNTLSETDKVELAQMILEESEHMSQLVRNLLEMTKLESGPTTIKKTWQAVEEIIGTALARLEHQLGERRIQITLEESLPLLAMDEVLMQNVFLNLFENCIKYTPSNSPVDVEAKQESETLVIRVMDRGPGLKPGEQDSIFTKFYRSKSNSKQHGFGLGLAICKAIVDLHGGKISAENRDGGGAIFSISIPIDMNQPNTDQMEETGMNSEDSPLLDSEDSPLLDRNNTAKIEMTQS